jgi:hypothetical protein
MEHSANTSLPKVFTKSHLDTYLREQWKAKGIELSGRQRMGVSAHELAKFSVRRNRSIYKPYVDLWVGVLDDFISWFISSGLSPGDR